MRPFLRSIFRYAAVALRATVAAASEAGDGMRAWWDEIKRGGSPIAMCTRATENPS